MKRTVVHITFDADKKLWTAKVSGMVICADERKARLITRGQVAMRDLLTQGYHGQIVLHTRDGRIQTEYTYGADPKRSKG